MKLYQIPVIILGFLFFLVHADVPVRTIRSTSAEKPLSLRMLKHVDFVSAFDAIYTQACAADELETLPAGFVRAWKSLKAGEDVEMRDFIEAFPVLYEQLLVYRNPIVTHDPCSEAPVLEAAVLEKIAALVTRMDKTDEELLEVLWDYAERIVNLEQQVQKLQERLGVKPEISE